MTDPATHLSSAQKRLLGIVAKSGRNGMDASTMNARASTLLAGLVALKLVEAKEPARSWMQPRYAATEAGLVLVPKKAERKPSRIDYEQAVFVVDRFFAAMTQSDSSSIAMTNSTYYDDGTELVTDFMNRFPGRSPGSLENAAMRLGTVLRRMTDDGYLEKTVQTNQAESSTEPRWQYVYHLEDAIFRDLMRGHHTPQSAAEAWSGYTPPVPEPDMTPLEVQLKALAEFGEQTDKLTILHGI
jgi:hypothetical protein